MKELSHLHFRPDSGWAARGSISPLARESYNLQSHRMFQEGRTIDFVPNDADFTHKEWYSLRNLRIPAVFPHAKRS
jgi:hypothetical protein